MHRELAASIRHLAEAADGIVPYNHPAVTRLIGALEADRAYPPSAFRTYYLLADALFAQDMVAAAGHFDQLARAVPRLPGLSVRPLNPPEHCQTSACYASHTAG